MKVSDTGVAMNYKLTGETNLIYGDFSMNKENISKVCKAILILKSEAEFGYIR